MLGEGKKRAEPKERTVGEIVDAELFSDSDKEVVREHVRGLNKEIAIAEKAVHELIKKRDSIVSMTEAEYAAEYL